MQVLLSLPAVVLSAVEGLVELALPGPMLTLRCPTYILRVAPADVIKMDNVLEIASVDRVEYICGEGCAVWAEALPYELHSHCWGTPVLEAVLRHQTPCMSFSMPVQSRKRE